MNNPFVSRGPVRDANLFIGRVHTLNEIAAFLRGNQSVSIIGPRKIGKTSLLFQLMRPSTWPSIGLVDSGGADFNRLDFRTSESGPNSYLFVYLDCEVLGEGRHEDIFGQFATEMAAALGDRGLPPEPSLETAIAKPTRLSFEAAGRKLNQRGRRVVLILDEFERISTNPNLDVNFFNALRSAAGRYQLVFLTASAKPLIELTYSGKSQEILSSPFFNIFAPLSLGLFSKAEAEQLIREPSREVSVLFEPATRNFIYELVGGHPFALQVACFHAYATPNNLSEIEQRTQAELASHFEYYWRNLSALEQATLRDVTSAATRARSDTTLRSVLRDLLQKCLLVLADGDYRYPSRAWEAFVAAQTDSTPSAATSMRFKQQLGIYEVLEPLGRGGMADVYKGRHPRLDRTVAIKVLPANLAHEADFRARFEREARAIAALKRPNIVQVFDFGEADGAYYMVMEYIAGKDLGNLIHERGRLALAEALPLLREVAAALDYAHTQGLVHRDVKPSNVLLEFGSNGNNPRAILTDFGIAKIVAGGSGMTKSAIVGTADYIAPEQIRASGEVDSRADIYSLGVMAYEMLTGRLPYAGENVANVIVGHLQLPIPDPHLLVPDLPLTAAGAVQRAMAKDPNDRFATAGEFVRALE
jgi:hypothetical protein